jgi:hypothetical protein
MPPLQGSNQLPLNSWGVAPVNYLSLLRSLASIELFECAIYYTHFPVGQTHQTYGPYLSAIARQADLTTRDDVFISDFTDRKPLTGSKQ